MRGEEFETINHPALDKETIQVPRFWSLPVQNELMSRDTALSLGSCLHTDGQVQYNRGEDCPLDQRTIFVGIASYRDWECRSTVDSIIANAKHPERIRIAVVDQIVDGDSVCNVPINPCDADPNQNLCKYKDQIDIYKMDAKLSVGPVFAGHIVHRMYRGEYYAMQSSVPVTYTNGWDNDIISQFESIQNEMAVISTFLGDVQESIGQHGESLRADRAIVCNVFFEGGLGESQDMKYLQYGSQPYRIPDVIGTPQLQPWWSAGFSFSRGHFVINVPYDPLQPMIYQGREISISIRGFTYGYDFYAPERNVGFHHYATRKNREARSKVPTFWENSSRWAEGTQKKSMQRLLDIIRMNPGTPATKRVHQEEDMYGLGGARTPEFFYDVFGINVADKVVDKDRQCSFVSSGGKMQHEFAPHLRSDGMGIDYSQL